MDMHHVMAFASLYIGDSQTMAAEAGVLGVPFVRFNDFVGRIGSLRELEDTYELGYGIHASVLPAGSPIRRNDGSLQPSGVEELYKRVEQLVAMPSEQRRKLWSERRMQMLEDKIDCAKFLTWFIENYPDSATQIRNADSSFWDRFKYGSISKRVVVCTTLFSGVGYLVVVIYSLDVFELVSFPGLDHVELCLCLSLDHFDSASPSLAWMLFKCTPSFPGLDVFQMHPLPQWLGCF